MARSSFTLATLMVVAGLSFASSDFISQTYDYSRAFAAIGLFATAAWAAYMHFFASDPMAKKDAWETLTYALVGATIVVMAPMLAQVLS